MYINGCIIWYVYHHWDLMVIDQLINGTIWCIYIYRVMILMVYWLVVSNMNFIFHFIYGMSSFPLTNSYFSRWLKPPTRYGFMVVVMGTGRKNRV